MGSLWHLVMKTFFMVLDHTLPETSEGHRASQFFPAAQFRLDGENTAPATKVADRLFSILTLWEPYRKFSFFKVILCIGKPMSFPLI